MTAACEDCEPIVLGGEVGQERDRHNAVTDQIEIPSDRDREE